MARLDPYLNFDGKTEEAFNFYKSVFGGEFMGGIMRYGDAPETENLSETDENKVMYVGLPIKDGFLNGSDVIEGFGNSLSVGNNVQIMITPDNKDEADSLFNALSAGGKVEAPLQDMFWGAYYGAFTDKFGINWMVHLPTNQQT